MKQLKDHLPSQQGRFGKFARTAPIKSLLLPLLAAVPLVVSASTNDFSGSGNYGVVDSSIVSLIIVGLIALVRARARAKTSANNTDGSIGSNR